MENDMDYEKIASSLGGIEQHLVSIDARLTRIETSQEEVSKVLFKGNGTPSVLNRLTTLEGESRAKAVHVGLVWTAIIALAVATVGPWAASKFEGKDRQPIETSQKAK